MAKMIRERIEIAGAVAPGMTVNAFGIIGDAVRDGLDDASAAKMAESSFKSVGAAAWIVADEICTHAEAMQAEEQEAIRKEAEEDAAEAHAQEVETLCLKPHPAHDEPDLEGYGIECRKPKDHPDTDVHRAGDLEW